MSAKEVSALAREYKFSRVRGVGGAEQLRRTHNGFWYVIAHENDTLAPPSSVDEPVALAIFKKDPDDNPDPISEKTYHSLRAALVAADTWDRAH